LLFDQHELSPGELFARPAQAEDDLKRKDDFSVKILMEAVKVALTIAEQQGRGTCLALFMAPREERVKIVRIVAVEL
jgi:hypothetical protein